MSLPLCRPREAVASWAGSLYAEHFEPSFRLGSGHVTREHVPPPADISILEQGRTLSGPRRAVTLALNDRCPNVINGKNAS